ncbi:uncharacterized protein LOC129278600 [Lytechinus pictus]|uniref:uncharacterized protein LOC129278600 n=1 Tax=Lytechinus pictus TaxID=7653 RepID=UPI0030B9E5E4
MMLKGMPKESSGEVGVRVEGRRVARVQPQKGHNVNDQGLSYTREIGNVKSVKPRARRSPSVHRPIVSKWDISQQEMLKISDSRASRGQGANSADSQPLLILTGLAMPMIGSKQATHLVPFHTDGMVPSCQKINVQDASKQSGYPISTGTKAVVLDQGLDGVRNSNGIGISNTNQEYVNFIISSQIDHTLTNYNQIANIQTNIDRSRVSYNGALQLPPSFDQRIPEFSDFTTDMAEGRVKSLSYNREMLASSLMHHDTSMYMVGEPGCKARLAHGEHHQTGKTDTETRKTMMNGKGSNAMEEGNGNKMQYVRNPCDKLTNAQISLGSVHDNHGCSWYINQNEQMSSNSNECFHPVRNTGPQWDTIPRNHRISINPQVKDLTVKPAHTKIDPSTFPQHCIDEKNKNSPCVKPLLQKAPRQIPRYKQGKDRISDDLKRQHLTYFNSLDRNGKTALLRCKYATLLKRRNKQLQRFDPKYRLSLKRMNNASQEVQNLSKLTKFNRPPRLSRMAKCNQNMLMLSDNPHVALGTAGSLDVADDHSVIDLTDDLPSIRHEDNKNPPAELSSRRPNSRLPSYEEAMTLRTKDINDRTSVDPLPAVARRLLLSSQEFFKNLQGLGKISRERLHTRSGRLIDSSTPISLMSSRNPHEVNPGSIEPLAVPQDATINNIYPSSQDCSLTSDKSELSIPSVPSAVVLPQSISGHGIRKPTNGTALSSHTHDLQKDCESGKCTDNTSRSQCVKMECDVETRPETGMKSGLSTDEPDTLFQLTDTSSWKDRRKDILVTITTGMDSLDEKQGIVYQGSERHTLKNAVVRIEDFRKRLTRLQKKTEDILDDKNASHLEQGKRQKLNHRSSNYGRQTRNEGTKQRGNPTSTADCSSRSRHNFQDFVPTILPTRTRTATSRLGHSSRVLAMELLQNDLDDVINDGMKVEDDINKDFDEDYTPRNKHARRHRVRRKISSSPLSFSTTTAASLPSSSSSSSPPFSSPLSSSDRCGVEVDTLTETESASVSFGSGSKSEHGSSVRVEIGTNSENHIKLKFVNLRSIYPGSSSGNQSQHQTSRKAKHKHKGNEKIDDSSKAAKEGNKTFMFDVGPKAKKRSSNNLETDTSFDSTSSEMDSVPEDPPLGIKKLIINKKRGETLLHRAAKLGNMEILRYCIDNGLEDVNVHDHAGYTSLHDSCVPGHLNVARFLINHGADVNAEAYDGTRPINDAVENNHVELVRLLLAHGADPFHPKPNGRTCIELALDQSSEMKSLIFGYLEDMKVERRDL